MQTGENEQGLRKIVDMTRLMSLVILGLHFYYYCYRAFEVWQLRSMITDKLMGNLHRTGLFDHFNNTKFWALGLLFISLIGVKGKKEEKLNYKIGIRYILVGLLIYFTSQLTLQIKTDIKNLAAI